MAIEIECPQCQALLRVPDEAAGEQAKCPHCEHVFDVPLPSAAVPPAAPPRPPEMPADPAETTPSGAYGDAPGYDAAAEANPYASPQAGFEQGGTTEMQLGQLDAGKALQISWDLFRANLPTLLLANGVVMFAGIVLSFVGQAINETDNAALIGIFQLASYAVQWFLGIGMMLVNLNVARGRPADVNMVLAGGPWFLRVALATILYSIMVGLGMLLFIIPGIYLACRFWPYQCFIVDRDCGVMESFNLASEYMEGNKMQSVVVGILAMVIALLGFLALCVGLFFAVPVITMMWVVAYLMITRQAIQRPAA